LAHIRAGRRTVGPDRRGRAPEGARWPLAKDNRQRPPRRNQTDKRSPSPLWFDCAAQSNVTAALANSTSSTGPKVDPNRLALERLLAGLDTFGVDRDSAIDVVASVALDSVPPQRRQACEFAVAAKQPQARSPVRWGFRPTPSVACLRTSPPRPNQARERRVVALRLRYPPLPEPS
jgi:hypothetical protein